MLKRSTHFGAISAYSQKNAINQKIASIKKKAGGVFSFVSELFIG